MIEKKPDEDEYSLIGCSDCENLKIVKGAPKTTGCPRCGKRINFKKARKLYQSKNKEKVVHARALKLAERSGKKEEYEQLLESGTVTGDIARTISDEKYLREMGISHMIPDEDEEVNLVDILRKKIKSKNPSRNEIVCMISDEYDFSSDEIQRCIKRMKEEDGLVEDGSGLRFP